MMLDGGGISIQLAVLTVSTLLLLLLALALPVAPANHPLWNPMTLNTPHRRRENRQ